MMELFGSIYDSFWITAQNLLDNVCDIVCEGQSDVLFAGDEFMYSLYYNKWNLIFYKEKIINKKILPHAIGLSLSFSNMKF